MKTANWRRHLAIIYAIAILVTFVMQIMLLIPSLRTQETNLGDSLQSAQTLARVSLTELQLHHLSDDLGQHKTSLVAGNTTYVLNELNWALTIGLYEIRSQTVSHQVTRASDSDWENLSLSLIQSSLDPLIAVEGIIVDEKPYLLVSQHLSSDKIAFAIADASYLQDPEERYRGTTTKTYIMTRSGETIALPEMIGETDDSLLPGTRYTVLSSIQSLLDGEATELDLERFDDVQVHLIASQLDRSNLVLLTEREPSAFGVLSQGSSSTILLISLAISTTVLLLLGFGSYISLREQRKYEYQLKEERDRSQQYLDVAAIVLLALDKRHRIAMINRAGAKLLGYGSTQELIGKDWMEFVDIDARRSVRAAFATVLTMTANLQHEAESTIVTRTGETRLISWNNSVMRRSDGTITGVLSSGRDITELRRTQQRQAESEQKLRLALEGANLGTWQYDPQSSTYTLEPSALTLLGYTDPEAPKRTLIGLLHPEDQARALDLMECHMSGLSPWYSIDYRILDAAGEYRWVRAMGQRIVESGQYTVHGVLRDISESRETREALAYHTEFEELLLQHFRALLNCRYDQVDELIRGSICAVSDFIGAEAAVLFTHIDEPNLAKAQTLVDSGVLCESNLLQIGNGLTWVREQIAQHRVVSVPDTDRLGAKAAEFKALLDTRGVNSVIALPFQDPSGGDGLLFFCNVSQHHAWHRDADEPLRLLVDMISSAYRRQNYEADLVKFQALADNANYGLCILDPDWVTTYANHCFEDLHGYSAGGCIGLPVEAYYPSGQIPALEECKLVLQKSGSFYRDDLMHQRQNGSTFPVSMNGSLICDDKGQALFAAMSSSDISERTQFIRQLQLSSDEVRRANEELRQFTYIVSHDLRSPLVNLKGFAQELRFSIQDLEPALRETLASQDENERDELRMVLDEDIPESLSFIDRSVENMDEMVNALLRLSRMGRRDLVLENLDVQHIVDDAVAAVAHQLAEHDGEAHVGALPSVTADRTSLRQIMGNLIGNAAKYLADDRPARLDISAEAQDGLWVFHIKDNGSGISEKEFDSVLAPFRRAGSQKVPGEGMGLPYVQALVRRHGGELWFESKLGVGSTFSFSLPKDER